MQITVQKLTRGISVRRRFGFSAIAMGLTVLVAPTSNAQEIHNLSDFGTESAQTENVIENLNDQSSTPPSVNFNDQSDGVTSNLSDSNNIGDADQSNSPFTPPSSFSKLDTSKFVPPAKPALKTAQGEAPPIDMNMLRQQLQPPADANVAQPKFTQPERAYPVDPMQVLSADRLAPTDTEPVIQAAQSPLQPTEQMQPPVDPYQHETTQAVLEPRADDTTFANTPPPYQSPPQTGPSVQFKSSQPQFEEPARVAQIPDQFESIKPTAPIQSSILSPRNRSGGIQSTTFTAPATTFNAPAKPTNFDTKPKSSNLKDAKKLISKYDVSSVSTPLPGEPVSMLEMLQKTPLHKRPQMINQYWETYENWASLQNCRTNADWLNQIPQPGSQADKILLHTAKSNARNTMLAAEIQLGRSLSELMEFIPNGDPNQSPVLPMDQPLISNYKTHYQWYNSRQMIPPQLKGIDQMLPKTLELITSRAQTVRNAQSATKQTQSALSNGQANISTVLEAGRLLQESKQGFVASVVAYNQAIGDYAMTISRNGRTPEQIVSMLIPVAKTDDVVKSAPAQPQNAAFVAGNSGIGGTPVTQSGFKSNDGSQALGPNAGTFRAPATAAGNAQPASSAGFPTGAPNPGNARRLGGGAPRAGNFGGGRRGQGPRGQGRPPGRAPIGGGAVGGFNQPPTQNFGDTPAAGNGLPQSQSFQQSPNNAASGADSNGGTFRSPSTPNRTTDNSTSFGDNSFQR